MTPPLTESELAVACDALRDVGLERAAACLEQSRWIRCAEQMPAKDEYVLATGGPSLDPTPFSVCRWLGQVDGYEWSNDTGGGIPFPTHWMPLPAPPAPVAPESPRCERCGGSGRWPSEWYGFTRMAERACPQCNGSGLAPGAESEER